MTRVYQKLKYGKLLLALLGQFIYNPSVRVESMGEKLHVPANRQQIHLPHGLMVDVWQKPTPKGITPYQFSHSFKGEQRRSPVVPHNLEQVALQLEQKLISNPDSILVALDRGGTTIGTALGLRTQIPFYVASANGNPAPEGWIQWLEEGAGKSLAIPPLPEGKRVILVDDILDSGGTYIKAIEAFRASGIPVDQVLTLVQTKREKTGAEAIHAVYPDVQVDSLYVIPQPIFDNVSQDYIFPS